MKWLQLLDLEIWQEAKKFSKEIIFIAKSTKLNRDYKLKEQIKDSSGSVMYTIAERFERNCDLDFHQLQKTRLEKLDPKFIPYRTMNYSTEENSKTLLYQHERLSVNAHNFITYLNKKRL